MSILLLLMGVSEMIQIVVFMGRGHCTGSMKPADPIQSRYLCVDLLELSKIFLSPY